MFTCIILKKYLIKYFIIQFISTVKILTMENKNIIIIFFSHVFLFLKLFFI